MAKAQETLHALVCNAFGYDKSIVRALAIRARQIGTHSGDQGLMDLAQRVLDAEAEAGRVLPCCVVHPIPDTNHEFHPSPVPGEDYCLHSWRVESERTFCRQPKAAHPRPE